MSLESQLFAAAGYGDIDRIKALLEKKVDVNAKHPILGGNALHMAASCLSNGEEKNAILGLLLSKGSDPNLKDHHGNTPPMLAANLDVHGETVKVFFGENNPKRINLAIKNNNSQTLEDVAHFHDAKGVLNLVEQAKAGLLPSDDKPEGFFVIAKNKCGDMLDSFRRAMKSDDETPSQETDASVTRL